MSAGAATSEEVDDVDTSYLTSMPATGLIAAASRRSTTTAPGWSLQGTGLPFAGRTAGHAAAPTAEVAVLGARSTDLPGLPSRAAPV